MTRVVIKLADAKRKPAPRLRLDLVGDDTVGGGVGGWEQVERGKKRKHQVMSHKAVPAFTLQLPLMINGMESRVGVDRSVESTCRTLLSWGRPGKKSKNPPRLHVDGAVRTPGNLLWVIDNIEWGPQVRNAAGARIQQEVVVSFVQWRKPIALGPAKKSRDRNKGKGKGKGKGKK